MTSISGEQINKDFELSLLELKNLASQVKVKMTRSNSKRNRDAKKPANANAASAKAALKHTEGDANATANFAGKPATHLTSCSNGHDALTFSNMHDYLGGETEIPFDDHFRLDKEFPPLPISPAATSNTAASSPASPAPKVPRCTEPVSADAMTTLLSEFRSVRELLNSRADALEGMIIKNSLTIAEVKEVGEKNSTQINALKEAFDSIAAQQAALKERLEKLEAQPLPSSNTSAAQVRRISDLESYFRRWNLILHGLEETDHQDIRRETIRVLQGVLPEAKDKIPGAVDTIHRLGPRRPNTTRGRPIIIQFAYRIHKEAIWSAAKKGDNPFLLANKLRLSLDFPPETRERRRLLWPQVDQARKDNKRAYYVGGRAFVDGVEIFPP